MSIYRDYWSQPQKKDEKKEEPITHQSNYVKNVLSGNKNLCKRESILSE